MPETGFVFRRAAFVPLDIVALPVLLGIGLRLLAKAGHGFVRRSGKLLPLLSA